jgi:hypothetical protein
MELSDITFKEVLQRNTINNSLQLSLKETGLLNVYSKSNNCKSIKSRLRRFFQTFLSNYKKESIVVLDTMLGIRQKKFKNKTVIEVSNPQTDFRFYQRI